MSEPVLLQPDPSTLLVSFHPKHGDSAAVSMAFTDAGTGKRYVFVAAPEVTDYLAALFATATGSPRIRATADQMEAQQREER